jgi:hypothetical protein
MYFSTANCNTPAWRNVVSRPEAGHRIGLDQQDKSFDNPAT